MFCPLTCHCISLQQGAARKVQPGRQDGRHLVHKTSSSPSPLSSRLANVIAIISPLSRHYLAIVHHHRVSSSSSSSYLLFFVFALLRHRVVVVVVVVVVAVAVAAAESSSSSTSCLVVISIIVTSPPPFPTSLRPTVGPQLRYNSTAVLPQTIKQTDFYAGDGLTYRYFRRVKRPTICDESRDLFLPSIDYFGTHNMPWVFSARGRARPLRPRPFVHKKPLPPPRLHIFKYLILATHGRSAVFNCGSFQVH